MKGSEAYLIVATELGDPKTTLEDLKPELVKLAQEYAKKNHKKWPPKPINDGWEVRIWSM